RYVRPGDPCFSIPDRLGDSFRTHDSIPAASRSRRKGRRPPSVAPARIWVLVRCLGGHRLADFVLWGPCRFRIEPQLAGRACRLATRTTQGGLMGKASPASDAAYWAVSPRVDARCWRWG